MGFAKGLKSIHENFFQFPQLTVLHPNDDGTVTVTCRGEDGREGLVRQNYNYRLTLPLALSNGVWGGAGKTSHGIVLSNRRHRDGSGHIPFFNQNVRVLHTVLPGVPFHLKTAGCCPDPLSNLSSSYPPNTTQRCCCGGISPRRPNAVVLRGESVICVFPFWRGFPGRVKTGGRCASLFPFCLAYFCPTVGSGSGSKGGSRTGSLWAYKIC
jgi:hypothetical protein